MGDNVQLIEGAYEAFGRGDIPAVIGILSDDIEWTSPETLPHGGQFRGKDGVGRFFEGLGARWSDLSLDVESVSDAGDGLVVGVMQAQGTLRDGGPSSYGAAHVFTIRSGKVARFREYTDVGSALG